MRKEESRETQRIYLNLGSTCDNNYLDYDFLKPLIEYFESKGWKFRLRFKENNITTCSAFFEKVKKSKEK